MKICLINNLYPPNGRGGAEVVVQNIARGLKDAGHEVVVIATASWRDKNSLRAKAREVDGIKVYEFFPANIYHYANGGRHNFISRFVWHILDIFNLHSFFVIRKILLDERPDIVWTHNLMGVGMLTGEAIRLLGLRHFHTVHDVQLSLPSGLIFYGREDSPEAKSRLRPVYEKITRELLGKPEIVFSPSKWLLDFYAGRGFFTDCQKIILQNPVVDSGEPRSRQTCRERGSLQVNFLYLGQIEEHKGVRLLVKTFRHLLNEGHDNLRLTVAGGGALAEEIKVLAFDEERIKITGPVPHEEVGKLFDEAEYLIVPSLCYENSPTVIFESFSHGVPVIASNLGGIPEVVRDNENGYLIYPTEDSLKSAILRAAAIDPFGGVSKMEHGAPPRVNPESSRGVDNYPNLCNNGNTTASSGSLTKYMEKIQVLLNQSATEVPNPEIPG